jgi:hypothetical protein
MKPALFPALLLLWASPAWSDPFSMNVEWSECLAKGGMQNMSFDCDTDAGSQVLVVSFSVGQPVPQMIGIEARVDVSSGPLCGGVPCAGPALPSWWQLQPAGCRAGHIVFSMDFSVPPYAQGAACADPWRNQLNAGGMNYAYPSTFYGGNPSVASIQMVGAVSFPPGVALVPGQEYYAFRFTIDNVKTVGSGACPDCCAPVYLIPSYLKIVQPVGAPGGDFVATASPFTALWQAGGGPCGPTPARRTTWGRIKSQYL